MLARSSLFLTINPFSSLLNCRTLSTIFRALQTIPTFRKYNGFSKLNEGQGQIQKVDTEFTDDRRYFPLPTLMTISCKKLFIRSFLFALPIKHVQRFFHLTLSCLVFLERFSFECRKVIGFALSTRCDWLKRFAPPFHPIRSKTKANCDALARFSRALRQPHVITSSFDWFNVLSVSYVIGQSNYFGFGFTTLKRKPLYHIKP